MIREFQVFEFRDCLSSSADGVEQKPAGKMENYECISSWPFTFAVMMTL